MIPDPRDWKPDKPQCVHHNDADNCFLCGTKGVSKGYNALLDTLPVPAKPETSASVVPVTVEEIPRSEALRRVEELLFGDLAYCVKHDSYEPCGVCAQNAINVQKLKDEEERIRRQAEAGRRATPPEPEDTQKPQVPPVTVAVNDPESKRRGRPPKYGRAMTVAERKAESRANREAKLKDAERRKLIADLMKMYSRRQPDIILSESRDATEERRGIARQERRSYLRELNSLSVEKLRLAIESSNPDARGRLHGERSGEGPRLYGQSEIERIIAARQHDASLFEDEEQDPNMAAGFRIKPEGTAPDSFEAKDPTADSADAVTSGSARPEYKPTPEEKLRDKVIAGLMSKYPGTHCPFCDETFGMKIDLENHLAEQYMKGERDMERQLDYIYMMAKVAPGRIPLDREPRGLPYQHYKAIRGGKTDLEDRFPSDAKQVIVVIS